MNKKIKISIKTNDVKLKTNDVGLALQVLERLDNNKVGSKFLDSMFGMSYPTESNEGDYQLKITKLGLGDEELENKSTTTSKGTKGRKGPYNGTYKTKKRIEEEMKKKSEKKPFAFKTWTEDEDLTIINSINAGMTNTQISYNPHLTKRHTPNSIMTRASGIRHYDEKRISKAANKMAKSLLQ